MSESPLFHINGVDIQWDTDKGTFTFFGIPSALFWINPSLLTMLQPLAEEIGYDLFRLQVASSASLGTEEDYHNMVTILGDTFEEGFLKWGRAVSSAGWGIFEIKSFDESNKRARVRVSNTWELLMQKDFPQGWGCPFIQGKIIGIFRHALKVNCWADEVEIHYGDDPYVEDAGQNMLSLVNQVLSFSEVSIDNQDIVMEPVCIESVVSQCLTLVTPMANRRRIKIDHQEPPTSNIAVLGNTEYVKEILLVFLSNATTYIQEEGDVSISYQIKDQDQVRITVSDNGPGIPKDKQSNIFEPFDRLDNASGHISGAGIGLPIAKLMAAVMNGQIGYSENTPNGASFWLDMPLQS